MDTYSQTCMMSSMRTEEKGAGNKALGEGSDGEDSSAINTHTHTQSGWRDVAGLCPPLTALPVPLTCPVMASTSQTGIKKQKLKQKN